MSTRRLPRSGNVPLAILLPLMLAAACAATPVSAQTEAAEPRAGESHRPAVLVELFTSQGCSSCPPADDLVEHWLQNEEFGDDVIFLSFHVDYWDSLGWPDPYASTANTQRQYAYAEAMGEKGVYTPQLVVNGHAHLAGTRARTARDVIRAAVRAQRRTPTQIELMQVETKRDGRNSVVNVTVKGARKGALIQAAFAENRRENRVPRGENAGRTLRSAAVVRAVSAPVLPARRGPTQLNLKLPEDVQAADWQAGQIVVWAQAQGNMRVFGAVKGPTLAPESSSQPLSAAHNPPPTHATKTSSRPEKPKQP